MSTHPALTAVLAQPFPPAVLFDADLRDGGLRAEIRDWSSGAPLFDGPFDGALRILIDGQYSLAHRASTVLWERRAG